MIYKIDKKNYFEIIFYIDKMGNILYNARLDRFSIPQNGGSIKYEFSSKSWLPEDTTRNLNGGKDKIIIENNSLNIFLDNMAQTVSLQYITENKNITADYSNIGFIEFSGPNERFDISKFSCDLVMIDKENGPLKFKGNIDFNIFGNLTIRFNLVGGDQKKISKIIISTYTFTYLGNNKISFSLNRFNSFSNVREIPAGLLEDQLKEKICLSIIDCNCDYYIKFKFKLTDEETNFYDKFKIGYKFSKCDTELNYYCFSKVTHNNKYNIKMPISCIPKYIYVYFKAYKNNIAIIKLPLIKFYLC